MVMIIYDFCHIHVWCLIRDVTVVEKRNVNNEESDLWRMATKFKYIAFVWYGKVTVPYQICDIEYELVLCFDSH